jgi:uncharacterized membrane protein
MNLAALTSASPIIQAHAYAAFAAIALGSFQFALPKGTAGHRALGFGWVGLMMGVAASSLFIHTIRTFGPFSAIHLLSLFTLFIVPFAVIAAARGRIETHRRTMFWTYVAALIVTGLFTLYPGRIMHKVVFGACRAALSCAYHARAAMPRGLNLWRVCGIGPPFP